MVLKRLLPNTLYGRALLMIVTPLVLVELIVTYVFFENHWETVSRRLALGVAGDISMVIHLLPQYITPLQRNSYLSAVRKNHNLSIEVLLETKLADIPNSSDIKGRHLERVLGKALQERISKPFLVNTRSHANQIEVLVEMDNSVLRILTSRKRITSTTTVVFILWLVGSSLIVLSVSIIFLRNQMRPIRRLAEMADAYGKSRQTEPIKPSGASEVRQATSAFIAMRERIHRQLEQRTEMLAGVSHDLRTPLTRMKLQIALLGDNSLDKNLQLSELEKDVTAMERMVKTYLNFARGDAGEGATNTNVANLLRHVVTDTKRNGISCIDLTVPNILPAIIKPNAFRRCIQNLLDNALRVSSQIEIAAQLSTDSVEVTIDDDGPGIPLKERETVFKAFHRLDTARSLDQESYGLGLTIARDIVRGHGGEITLTDSPLGGLRVHIRLPS